MRGLGTALVAGCALVSTALTAGLPERDALLLDSIWKGEIKSRDGRTLLVRDDSEVAAAAPVSPAKLEKRLLGLFGVARSGLEIIEDFYCLINAPWNRRCWLPQFTVNNPPHQQPPETGTVRKYFLDVVEITAAPDGFARQMVTFNGQFPGPTLWADWGDWMEITVRNSLSKTGTGIHWHGIRQVGTNTEDGTNGLTECPIAPGQSKVYRFRAIDHGTSWYHSHYSSQYSDGLVGAIVINGPTTANFDIDLGPYMMMDWFHTPVQTIIEGPLNTPPSAQTILVNGTGVFNGQGRFPTTLLVPGKLHKLRLINSGTNNYMNVALDGHRFLVVANDLVPIRPFFTQSLTLAVGQRYDVIIEANQRPANYWFRVRIGRSTGGTCDGPNEKTGTEGGVFSYLGAEQGLPQTQATALKSGCVDEVNLIPQAVVNVPPPQAQPTLLTLTVNTVRNGVEWDVNGSPMLIDWTQPTLESLQNGTANMLSSRENALFVQGGPQTWIYYTIQNNTPVPHPIHLHGHDFILIDSGTGQVNPRTQKFNLNNPVRRDTHSVDANAWITVAFAADNPGVWLMHCHIPFHISFGLGLQIVERPNEILPSVLANVQGGLTGLNQNCATWRRFQFGTPGFRQPDSGLKF